MPESIPSADSLLREQQRLAAQYAEDEANNVPHFDRTRAVTDPVITPFVRAMVSEGYSTKMTSRGDCVHLETCPNCRSRYRFTFVKDGLERKCCPYCRQ